MMSYAWALDLDRRFEAWKKLAHAATVPSPLAASVFQMTFTGDQWLLPGRSHHEPLIPPPYTLITKSHRIKMKSGSPSRSFESNFSISSQPDTHTHTHTYIYINTHIERESFTFLMLNISSLACLPNNYKFSLLIT